MISSCVAPVGGCLDLTTFSFICIFCHGALHQRIYKISFVSKSVGIDWMVWCLRRGFPPNFHLSLHITSFLR